MTMSTHEDITYFCLWLFTPGLLLCALVVSCKREMIPLPPGSCSQKLIGGNTERPGEDCKVNISIETNFCLPNTCMYIQ